MERPLSIEDGVIRLTKLGKQRNFVEIMPDSDHLEYFPVILMDLKDAQTIVELLTPPKEK